MNLGPMQLNHGTPSHAALDLIAGSVRGDTPALWLYDGVPDEVLELLSALAKASAVLAGVLSEKYRDAGGWSSALDIVEALRAQQLAPGERFAL